MTAHLILSLLVPVAGSALIVLLRRNPNLREAASLVTAGVLFAVVLRIYGAVSDGARPEVILAEPFPGIPIALEAEPLGVLFALIASFLWIVTTAYSIGYMRGHHEKNQTRFYFFFAFAIASVMGVAFAGNLFTLFVFYEVLSLTTFPLVTHAGTEKPRGGQGACTWGSSSRPRSCSSCSGSSGCTPRPAPWTSPPAEFCAETWRRGRCRCCSRCSSSGSARLP